MIGAKILYKNVKFSLANSKSNSFPDKKSWIRANPVLECQHWN